MLKSLYIKNYALIKDIQLHFEDSFVTITGETGAGKSILLGALSLLLGNRADKDSLRDIQEKCIIEAEFDFSNFKLEKVFKEYDLDYEVQCIIRREITSQRTRAFINDTPVKLKVLQELKPFLIDIHSQNESQSLSQKEYQYNVLDKIAGHQKLIKNYRVNLSQYKDLQTQLNSLHERKNESAKKQDYNQFLFEELEKSNIHEGLLQSLENDFQSLQHADDIQQYLSECIAIIQQEEHGVYDQLAIANQRLQNLSQSLSSFKDIKERLQSVLIEIEDVGVELENRLENVEVNPEKLEEVDEKLRTLNSLLQKHQVKTDTELIQIKNQLEDDLSDYSEFDEKIKTVENDLKVTKKSLEDLSKQMLSNRKEASQVLEKKLLTIFSNLGMENATVNVALKPSDDFHSFGKDEINWMFSANKGMPLRPLQKVASGGELSRIMLAIKSTLATYENLPSIIFDEIDTGVSGEIALKMAEIMNQMSQRMQVISITHLPQIASKGKQHLKVIKSSDQTSTETQIKHLNDEERIVELSQMLGGHKNSNSAIAHAKSLLN